MRRSEWRRRADDPTTLLGWWWRGVALEGRLDFFGFGLTVLSLFLVLCGLHEAFLPLVVGLAAAAIHQRVVHHDRLGPLLPNPPPDGQFRAAITYRREGLVLGKDEMALSVVDGWLYGEGLRSHFALRADDVRLLWYRRETIRSIVTLTDGTQIDIVGYGNETHRSLVRWRHATERPQGESTFPPSKTHLQEIARWLIWSVAAGGSIFLSIALAFIPQLVARYGGIGMGASLIGLATFLLAGHNLSRLVAISTAARRQEALTGQASVPQDAALPEEPWLEEARVRA